VAFQINQFRCALIKWYRRHGRDLPWRNTRDPYRIVASEFMLQQTQVATVLPYYTNWLRQFPNFGALARASESNVLHAWQGLGYYARARNFHATAKLVRDRHRLRFPKSIGEMRRLPGIGRYTAHAVATFAFNQAVPIIEANSARVLTRLFDVRIPIDSTKGQTILWRRAVSLVPKHNAASYNSALLDLGALVCVSRTPKCGICPVKKFCRAKDPGSLPIKRSRPATKRLVERRSFILRDDKLLLTKATNRWRGMWILPSLNGASMNKGAIHESVYPFTNHRIALKIFRARVCKIDKRRHRWFSRSELHSIPIPSPHRRAIEQLVANA
jgi:A/G-specific adenine glycosylase